MHKFTDDASLIGVPATASRRVFQTSVTQMIVQSNIESLKLRVVLEGNIEFWPNDYAMGSSGVYDWEDERNNGGSYGSMQVNVPSLETTVFAFNRWNRNSAPDIGIGMLLINTLTGHLPRTATRIKSRLLRCG